MDDHTNIDRARQNVHNIVDDIGKGLDGLIADVKTEVKKAQANFDERMNHARAHNEHSKDDKQK